MGILNDTEPHWYKCKKESGHPQDSVLSARLATYRRGGRDSRWICYQDCALQLLSHLNAYYNLTSVIILSIKERGAQRGGWYDTQKWHDGWVQAPSNTVYPNGKDSENKYSSHSKNNSHETTSPFILCPTSLNCPGRNRNNPVIRKVGSGATSAQVCKPALP